MLEDLPRRSKFKKSIKADARRKANYKVRTTLTNPLETVVYGTVLSAGVPLVVNRFEK
jgi:hypothetical protein